MPTTQSASECAALMVPLLPASRESNEMPVLQDNTQSQSGAELQSRPYERNHTSWEAMDDMLVN